MLKLIRLLFVLALVGVCWFVLSLISLCLLCWCFGGVIVVSVLFRLVFGLWYYMYVYIIASRGVVVICVCKLLSFFDVLLFCDSMFSVVLLRARVFDSVVYTCVCLSALLFVASCFLVC